MTLRIGRVRVGPVVAVAALVLIVIAVAVFAPGLLATHPPDEVDPVRALRGPSGGAWFGTDQLGRDVYSRIVYGARPAVTIGVAVTVFAVVASSALAMIAVSFGRAADEIVMRITDVFLAFPGVLLALLVVAVLGPGSVNATVAIGLAFVPGFTRLIRGQALVIREADYVEAALICGQRRSLAYLRHVLPNALPPILVLATINVGTAMLAGSALSFLGLGPRPPAADWGTMLADGQQVMGSSWAMALFPGAALTLTVLAVNIVGKDLVRALGTGSPAGSLAEEKEFDVRV
jgi:peptide/nickel transport system permease protein